MIALILIGIAIVLPVIAGIIIKLDRAGPDTPPNSGELGLMVMAIILSLCCLTIAGGIGIIHAIKAGSAHAATSSLPQD